MSISTKLATAAATCAVMAPMPFVVGINVPQIPVEMVGILTAALCSSALMLGGFAVETSAENFFRSKKAEQKNNSHAPEISKTKTIAAEIENVLVKQPVQNKENDVPTTSTATREISSKLKPQNAEIKKF